MEQIKMVIEEEKLDGRDLLVGYIKKYSNKFDIKLNEKDVLNVIFLINKNIVKVNKDLKLTYPIQAQIGWLISSLKGMSTDEILNLVKEEINKEVLNTRKYQQAEKRKELEEEYFYIKNNMLEYVVKK